MLGRSTLLTLLKEVICDVLEKVGSQFTHNTGGIYETYRNTIKHSFVVEMLAQM